LRSTATLSRGKREFSARAISPVPAFLEAGFKKSFELFLAQKNGKKMFLSDFLAEN
jgi:hypothetical protein